MARRKKPIIAYRTCEVCGVPFGAKSEIAKVCQMCRDSSSRVSEKRLLRFALQQLETNKEALVQQFKEHNMSIYAEKLRILQSRLIPK